MFNWDIWMTAMILSLAPSLQGNEWRRVVSTALHAYHHSKMDHLKLHFCMQVSV